MLQRSSVFGLGVATVPMSEQDDYRRTGHSPREACGGNNAPSFTLHQRVPTSIQARALQGVPAFTRTGTTRVEEMLQKPLLTVTLEQNLTIVLGRRRTDYTSVPWDPDDLQRPPPKDKAWAPAPVRRRIIPGGGIQMVHQPAKLRLVVPQATDRGSRCHSARRSRKQVYSARSSSCDALCLPILLCTYRLAHVLVLVLVLVLVCAQEEASAGGTEQ